jgi:hypothetical protein
MYVVEEEGDFVGWDLRVTKLLDGYHLTLFCGEGEIQGPVYATFRLKDGTVVIYPDNKVCGATLERASRPVAFKSRSVMEISNSFLKIRISSRRNAGNEADIGTGCGLDSCGW